VAVVIQASRIRSPGLGGRRLADPKRRLRKSRLSSRVSARRFLLGPTTGACVRGSEVRVVSVCRSRGVDSPRRRSGGGMRVVVTATKQRGRP